MLSCPGQRVEESVPEMDWQGTKAEADRLSRQRRTGLLEYGQHFL